MKVLKKILIVLLSLLLIVIAASYVVTTSYQVERDIVIDEPREALFDYLVLLKNQSAFSKWDKMDPNMKRTEAGTDGQIGFMVGWESEDPNVGKGEQEIIGIQAGERIDYELRFVEPFESTDKAYLKLSSVSENQTKVAWGMHGNMPRPYNLMSLFMSMEDMLGPDLDEGLQNLKQLREN